MNNHIFNVFNVLVLNLKRRSDRRRTFQQWNNQDGVRYEFVEAVDGSQLNIAELVKSGLVSEGYQSFSPGQLGCALSHRSLWERCLKESQPLLICEDDAVLRGDFSTSFTKITQQLPPNWDIILLGYNLDSILDVEFIPGIDMRAGFSRYILQEKDLKKFIDWRKEPDLIPLRNAFGLCAYALSPKGAKQLMESCFPLTNLSVPVPALRRNVTSFSIDCLTNAQYRNIQAFCVIPPLGISPNDDSDTQKIESESTMFEII